MKHYVYRLHDPITKEYYIGSRSCECKIEDDDYMGSMQTWKPTDSSKLVKTILKSNFRKRETAIRYESKIIKENINNPLNRNYNIPTEGWHTLGKKHTEETRSKIKQKRAKQTLTEIQLHVLRTNNLGKKFSKEHRDKISNSKLEYYKHNNVYNKGVPTPEWVRKRISESKMGTKLSDEHKMKLSELALNRVNVKCPYCDKKGHVGIMSRWHFDNCKYKK